MINLTSFPQNTEFCQDCSDIFTREIENLHVVVSRSCSLTVSPQDVTNYHIWSKVILFLCPFLCIHFAPNTLQSSPSLYLRCKLPTQPFWRSKQGQQQDHINQIITESSGTEAIGTLASHFPSNLSLANSQLFCCSSFQSLAFPHFNCSTLTTLCIPNTDYWHLWWNKPDTR